MILELQGHVYTAGKAKLVARQLQDNEADGWSYFVELMPTDDTYARVTVFDESGAFMGRFNV